MKEKGEEAVETFQELLKAAPESCALKREQFKCVSDVKQEELYEHMVKSTLFMGELYNCGRCSRTHAGFGGGVVVSEDGLALTNYHVLKARTEGKTEGIFAMAWDGTIYDIDEVLFANERNDVALIRLKTNGGQLYAAPIADIAPRPMDKIRIVSHPYGEFYVLTTGEVSRYSKIAKSFRKPTKETWMEVTADFGGGSSGCAVFNNRGEVVGLVSTIRPLVRKIPPTKEAKARNSGLSKYVEMLLKRCVPLTAIHAGLNAEVAQTQGEPSVEEEQTAN